MFAWFKVQWLNLMKTPKTYLIEEASWLKVQGIDGLLQKVQHSENPDTEIEIWAKSCKTKFKTDDEKLGQYLS